MRTTFIVILAASLAAACTRPNPAVCCDTAEQCSSLGVTDPRPCSVGQACLDFECVASQCTTSADCDDPAAPVCRDRVCVDACRSDTECTAVASGPYCAADGQCIACRTDDDCSSAAPICDAQTRACRGCETDDQCASGLCVEADGVCASESEVVYVSSTGGDAGECDKQSPCATMGFALLKVTSSRDILRLLGGSLPISATIVIDRPVTIDGTNTTLRRPPAGPAFRITTPGLVRMESVNLVSQPSAIDAVTVGAGASFILSSSAMHSSTISTSGGSITLRKVKSSSTAILCTNGVVTVEDSVLEEGRTESMNCVLAYTRNHVSAADGGMIDAQGGNVAITNNLFVQSYELADSIRISAAAPGSLFAFNTIVNTSSLLSSGVALTCGASLAVEGNIFAYNSTNPLDSDSCVAKHSLFDAPGAADSAFSSTNVSGDIATFFGGLSGGDFTLALDSPAKGLGTLHDVTLDITRSTRPKPVGSNPDAGAFEAP